jgi:hypothetical protein
MLNEVISLSIQDNIHSTPSPSPSKQDVEFELNITNSETSHRNIVIDDNNSETSHPIKNELENLRDYCEYKRELHYICHKYYEKWQYRFQIPGIIITSIGGILSFFSTSSIFSSSDIKFLTLLVGTFASMSAILQTSLNLFDFSGKSVTHEYAVMSYDQIITKIRFILLKKKESAVEDIERIEQLVFELKQRCKYITPSWAEKMHIIAKYKHKQSIQLLKLRDIKVQKKEELKLSKFEEKIKTNKI